MVSCSFSRWGFNKLIFQNLTRTFSAKGNGWGFSDFSFRTLLDLWQDREKLLGQIMLARQTDRNIENIRKAGTFIYDRSDSYQKPGTNQRYILRGTIDFGSRLVTETSTRCRYQDNKVNKNCQNSSVMPKQQMLWKKTNIAKKKIWLKYKSSILKVEALPERRQTLGQEMQKMLGPWGGKQPLAKQETWSTDRTETHFGPRPSLLFLSPSHTILVSFLSEQLCRGLSKRAFSADKWISESFSCIIQELQSTIPGWAELPWPAWSREARGSRSKPPLLNAHWRIP